MLHQTLSISYVLLAWAVVVEQSQAQTSWSLLTPSVTAPSRHGHSGMTFDSARDAMVMFGGRGATGSLLSDTWEFTAGTWVQRLPATIPPARTGHALQYDEGHALTVLFGGNNGTANLNDTWLWDGSNWLAVSTANSPSPRNYHSMAYDSTRGVVVLFGGWNSTTNFNQTWEFDGANWLQRTLTTSPVARSNHGMCYDSARGRMVVFGGWNNSGYRADTWEWDGSAAGWIQRFPATVPSQRRGHVMSYDAARGRTVMFGGHGSGTANAETWEWDGTDWTLRLPITNPAPHIVAASAYDPPRRRMLMFGGGNGSTVTYLETWSYEPVVPAEFVPFGAGCAGPAGVPQLSSDPGAWPLSLPWLGQTFVAELSNLGSDPTHVPLRVLGTSATSSGGVPLPANLSVLGMPGCSLYTDIVDIEVLGNNHGIANWSLPIPVNPSLSGVELYAQGFVFVAGWNPFGMIASNACRLRIGAR